MDKLIEKFPAQLQEGLEIGDRATINIHDNSIQNIVILGMGASGIGGDFIREFVKSECKVPVIVSKGYTAPAFVSINTLVIVSSYSGNTEETLNAYEGVRDSGAKIVCISSGGKLIDIAKENSHDYIQLPSGWTSPRACLGFSIIEQLYVLTKLGLISGKSLDSIRISIDKIKFNTDEIQAIAKKVANSLVGKIPIIYTTDRMEAVAVRYRQQLNENAKSLAWTGVIPEMNHNELEAWRNKNGSLAVLYLRFKDELPRNKVRIEINKKIISAYCDTILEVEAKGNTLVEQSMYLVHVGDWISYYLSQLYNRDSIEIKAIDYLKSELAKI